MMRFEQKAAGSKTISLGGKKGAGIEKNSKTPGLTTCTVGVVARGKG